MRLPHVDDFVRLTRDVPELHLQRGCLGVVRSTWCAPMMAYEVEFAGGPEEQPRRTLLMDDQLLVQEADQLSLEEHLVLAMRNTPAS